MSRKSRARSRLEGMHKMLLGAGVLVASALVLANDAEAPFLKENEAAMAKMMAAMAVTPTGDVDRDFVATMVPHHQGAIEMAQAELRYGHNEQLRRLAQEIIVNQTQEIAVMRLAVGERPKCSWRRSRSHGSRAPRSRGRFRARYRLLRFRSLTVTGCMPPNSFPSRCRLRMPPTTRCWA